MYLKSDTSLLAVFGNFRKMCLKIYHSNPAKLLSACGLAWQAALKKTEVKLELLTDIDMLLMVKKEIIKGICHAIQQYTKANNKYLKYYNKNRESSYLKYLYVNNLYCCTMSQKRPVNNFETIGDTSQFNEDFMKSYNKESDEGFFLEVDVQYTQKLLELHNDLPFSSERIKIKKVEKLVIHIRNLKQAINHRLVLKKVHRVIKLNQKARLKPYI